VGPLKLKFSHVDVLVKDLEEACRYYARVFSAKISKTLDWQRDGLHVRYAIVMFGTERLMLVQPFTGNLKALMDANGEGTIYRHCYSTPDIEAAYNELIDAGVQPENENGKPLSRDNLQSPSGTRILWLPKRFGHFSIELLEEKELEAFIKEAFAEEDLSLVAIHPYVPSVNLLEPPPLQEQPHPERHGKDRQQPQIKPQ
jgi:methylmalonyl-CoA/ethylmalonyl-CoA epimerase